MYNSKEYDSIIKDRLYQINQVPVMHTVTEEFGSLLLVMCFSFLVTASLKNEAKPEIIINIEKAFTLEKFSCNTKWKIVEENTVTCYSTCSYL